MLLDDSCGICQFLRRLKFTLGIDNFCPPLSLGLRLFGHGSLHLRRQIDMFQFDRGHLNPPGVGVGVQYFLKLGVDFFPCG